MTSAVPYAEYLPITVRPDGTTVAGATAHDVPVDDLFGSIDAFMRRLLEDPAQHAAAQGIAASVVAFVLAPDLAVTVNLPSVRPSHVQCLLAVLNRRMPPVQSGTLAGLPIDPATGLTLWTRAGPAAAELAARLWSKIVTAGILEPLSPLTTPWLYGNKLRLTRFVAPVATTALPAGAPLLDLMAGTGVIGRALSDEFEVFSNDPNPYAALLARCQGVDGRNVDVSGIKGALRPAYAENHRHLEALLASRIEEESSFLHGNPTGPALERYAAFAATTVLPLTDGKTSTVARLATERYANVYFGLAQTVEIDSLRIAVERALPAKGIARDLCLCALLIACTICASGPHFAQPARARTLKAFRTMVERRARSVAWEFDLALGRLVARRPPALAMSQTTSLDWREALACFALRAPSRPAGVYIDPPYSKLQYSRYYHVLNVLLTYDYPAVSGIGRYPPREQRFSSRFEYQPGVARRELADLLRSCAAMKLTTILSYGEGGFVRVGDLAGVMAGLFSRVEIFSEKLRHHSQGRPLGALRATVLEHVLVGFPNL